MPHRSWLAAGALSLAALLPVTAFGASATASQNVNVRSGPSASYSVVAQLAKGDSVDVRQCEGLFCQVSFNGKTGWVSASFLTRDYVPKPPPQTTVASAAPATSPATTLPPAAAFPPAYDAATSPDIAPQTDVPSPDPGARSDRYASADSGDGSFSSVTLPADSGETVFSVAPPRPHADVPDDANADMTDAPPADIGAMDDPGASDDDGPQIDDPPPRWGDRFGGPMGWHAAADEQACLLSEVGRSGFCVGPGERTRQLPRFGVNIAWLRNPSHLDVTICTNLGDCRTYRGSGPLRLAPGETVSSISAGPSPGF